MKKNRLIVLGLFILSVIAISLVGGAASYGFFFFMLFVPVVSLLYTVIVYFRFKIYQKIEGKTVVADTAAAFYFTLQNEDPFAHAGIKTGFFSDFSVISGLDDDTEYELMPHKGISKETRLICKYRGEYEVGIKNVTVTDYLKLFSITFKNRETLRVTVLPHLEILSDVAGLNEVISSAFESSNDPDDRDILVRKYVPGDDTRLINWKATARTGEPMVRKDIGESSPSVTIIMDSCRYSEEPEDYLPPENKLIETLLSLTYYCIERGIRVGVYAYDRHPVNRTVSHTDEFEDFYQAVSLFFCDRENSPELLYKDVLSTPGACDGNAVIMLTQRWGSVERVSALEFSERASSVLVYLISDEEPSADTGAYPEHIKIVRIGYGDRLGEVLS